MTNNVENIPTIIKTNTEQIQNLIYVIRGKQVMVDSDLAMLYEVETKRLNEAVKRNMLRFPAHFRFQLTEKEVVFLRSHFATSKPKTENNKGGRRYLPYVYTEQGIAMLSAVLKSSIAIQVSIRIMDTFVEMRKYAANSSLIYDRVNTIEMRQSLYQEQTDRKLEQIFDYIAEHKENNQKIFYDGQIFDAFSLMTSLIEQADKEIILIDGYIDIMTLNILAKKKNNVKVIVYTLPNTKLTKQDITVFNTQYPVLHVKHTKAFHDRFLILDSKTGYHIGASIKDAGKKCFGINQIEDIEIITDLIQRVELIN